MIAWLRGRVINIDGNEVTINAGNIGYCVFLGDNRLLQMGIQKDQEIELVVYTVVREDEIRLFGFDSFVSRNLFVILMSVSGIGPKAAMNIVDRLEAQQIVNAVQTGDISPFLSISGIGKKTAQRIILDLQGKMDGFSRLLPGNDQKNRRSIAGLQDKGKMPLTVLEDAKSALSNLGFSEREADRVIRQHLKPGIELDEIIRKSLADLRQ